MEIAATTLDALPDEMIIMILKRTSYADCNSFRRTCKRYNDLLKHCHSLWRMIYHKTVGEVIYNKTASECTVDWCHELKQYLILSGKLINLVMLMSPIHFSDCDKGMPLESCREIFGIALSSSRNYYYTLTILQNFVEEALKRVNTCKTKKPYTLTEIHYGKMVVRYLMNVLYSLKWVHHTLSSQLTPDIVLTFFMQWLDPLHMHTDEELSDLIKGMVKDVEQLLLESSASSACAGGLYSEKQVLMAISHYMYKRRRMLLVAACNPDTLDIIKTIKCNSGHSACLGSIFQAIARGFGITTCTLIAFPNHLYLEWRPSKGFETDTMPRRFNLENGDLRGLGRCPFSGHDNQMNRFKYTYTPENFINYIISAFLADMGEIKGWHTDNALQLLAFLSNSAGPYLNFLQCLSAWATCDRDTLARPLHIQHIHEDHGTYISYLLDVNELPTKQYRDVSVREHKSQVQYCVGMICLHKVFEYVCVVREWDACWSAARGGAAPARARASPFYLVTAADRSDRYVAQENLVLVPNPSRIYHLEDCIGKEFTHFNGFFYEPNAEKQQQYPGCMAIANMYADKYFAHLIPDKVQRY